MNVQFFRTVGKPAILFTLLVLLVLGGERSAHRDRRGAQSHLLHHRRLPELYRQHRVHAE
jgi:hypothetical protein